MTDGLWCFCGERTKRGCTVVAVRDGTVRPLPLRLDLARHSPDGFEWGYAGSGPAQLALALCAAVLVDDDARALRVYQRVKWSMVATMIEADRWRLSADQVMRAIEAAEGVRR